MSSSASPSTRDRPRVAIVGAGVCGLGIAWRLAEAGCRVDVFDRDRAGRGATWASAGMLAAGIESEPGEQPLSELGRRAQRLWPDFARELAEASGIDPEYRDEGTLVVATNHDEAEHLRFNVEFQQSLGVELEWLTAAEARRREPHLRAGVAGAVYSPNDRQVNNRRLAEGLKVAAERAGAAVHEETAVTGLMVEGGRATGLRLGEARHEADAIVLAAGAWTRDVPGLPEAARPPVRPIKGQVIALRMDPRAPVLSHVLWAPTIYMVPRLGGQLVIGGTVEERGYDETLTAGGIYALLEAARRAIPTIEELAIDEMWVGFRPGCRDDAPVLGPTPVDGLWLATGHHRNGILLAPITADAMSRSILEGEPAEEIRGFGIERFAASTPQRRPEPHLEER